VPACYAGAAARENSRVRQGGHAARKGSLHIVGRREFSSRQPGPVSWHEISGLSVWASQKGGTSEKRTGIPVSLGGRVR